MNYLLLQVLFIGLIVLVLPSKAENEKGADLYREHIFPSRFDGSDEMAADKRYRLAGKHYKLADKRYRLAGKRAFDDDSDESDELEKRYRLAGKRYRLAGKRFFDDDRDELAELEKRYRLAGKSKRYRLMGKRSGDFDSYEEISSESEDLSNESIQKRRLHGNKKYRYF